MQYMLSNMFVTQSNDYVHKQSQKTLSFLHSNLSIHRQTVQTIQKSNFTPEAPMSHGFTQVPHSRPPHGEYKEPRNWDESMDSSRSERSETRRGEQIERGTGLERAACKDHSDDEMHQVSGHKSPSQKANASRSGLLNENTNGKSDDNIKKKVIIKEIGNSKECKLNANNTQNSEDNGQLGPQSSTLEGQAAYNITRSQNEQVMNKESNQDATKQSLSKGSPGQSEIKKNSPIGEINLDKVDNTCKQNSSNCDENKRPHISPIKNASSPLRDPKSILQENEGSRLIEKNVKEKNMDRVWLQKNRVVSNQRSTKHYRVKRHDASEDDEMSQNEEQAAARRQMSDLEQMQMNIDFHQRDLEALNYNQMRLYLVKCIQHFTNQLGLLQDSYKSSLPALSPHPQHHQRFGTSQSRMDIHKHRGDQQIFNKSSCGPNQLSKKRQPHIDITTGQSLRASKLQQNLDFSGMRSSSPIKSGMMGASQGMAHPSTIPNHHNQHQMDQNFDHNKNGYAVDSLSHSLFGGAATSNMDSHDNMFNNTKNRFGSNQSNDNLNDRANSSSLQGHSGIFDRYAHLQPSGALFPRPSSKQQFLSPTQKLQHVLTPLIQDCVDELKGWEKVRQENLENWWQAYNQTNGCRVRNPYEANRLLFRSESPFLRASQTIRHNQPFVTPALGMQPSPNLQHLIPKNPSNSMHVPAGVQGLDYALAHSSLQVQKNQKAKRSREPRFIPNDKIVSAKQKTFKEFQQPGYEFSSIDKKKSLKSLQESSSQLPVLKDQFQQNYEPYKEYVQGKSDQKTAQFIDILIHQKKSRDGSNRTSQSALVSAPNQGKQEPSDVNGMGMNEMVIQQPQNDQIMANKDPHNIQLQQVPKPNQETILLNSSIPGSFPSNLAKTSSNFKEPQQPLQAMTQSQQPQLPAPSPPASSPSSSGSSSDDGIRRGLVQVWQLESKSKNTKQMGFQGEEGKDNPAKSRVDREMAIEVAKKHGILALNTLLQRRSVDINQKDELARDCKDEQGRAAEAKKDDKETPGNSQHNQLAKQDKVIQNIPNQTLIQTSDENAKHQKVESEPEVKKRQMERTKQISAKVQVQDPLSSIKKYGLRNTNTRRSQHQQANVEIEFMQLNKQGKPQEISKISNPSEWNFTGRPINEIVETRKKNLKDIDRPINGVGKSQQQKSQQLSQVFEKPKDRKVSLKIINSYKKNEEPSQPKITQNQDAKNKFEDSETNQDIKLGDRNIQEQGMELMNLEKVNAQAAKESQRLQVAEDKKIETKSVNIDKSAPKQSTLKNKPKPFVSIKKNQNVWKPQKKSDNLKAKKPTQVSIQSSQIVDLNESKFREYVSNLMNDQGNESSKEEMSQSQVNVSPDDHSQSVADVAPIQINHPQQISQIPLISESQGAAPRADFANHNQLQIPNMLDLHTERQQIVQAQQQFEQRDSYQSHQKITTSSPAVGLPQQSSNQKQSVVNFEEDYQQIAQTGSSLVDYDQNGNGNNSDLNIYKCQFCKKIFPVRSALGGHISKAHPGKSKSYNHKRTVRDRRELLRDLHKVAMQIYMKEKLHLQPNAKISKSHRVFKIASEYRSSETNADANNQCEAMGGSSLADPNQAMSPEKVESETQYGKLYEHGCLKEANINRNTVKRIKKLLVMNNRKYKSIRSNFIPVKDSSNRSEQVSNDNESENQKVKQQIGSNSSKTIKKSGKHSQTVALRNSKSSQYGAQPRMATRNSKNFKNNHMDDSSSSYELEDDDEELESDEVNSDVDKNSNGSNQDGQKAATRLGKQREGNRDKDVDKKDPQDFEMYDNGLENEVGVIKGQAKNGETGGGYESDQSFDILKQISQEIKDDPIPMLDNCLKQNSGIGTRGRPPMDLYMEDSADHPSPKTRLGVKKRLTWIEKQNVLRQNKQSVQVNNQRMKLRKKTNVQDVERQEEHCVTERRLESSKNPLVETKTTKMLNEALSSRSYLKSDTLNKHKAPSSNIHSKAILSRLDALEVDHVNAICSALDNDQNLNQFSIPKTQNQKQGKSNGHQPITRNMRSVPASGAGNTNIQKPSTRQGAKAETIAAAAAASSHRASAAHGGEGIDLEDLLEKKKPRFIKKYQQGSGTGTQVGGREVTAPAASQLNQTEEKAGEKKHAFDAGKLNEHSVAKKQVPSSQRPSQPSEKNPKSQKKDERKQN